MDAQATRASPLGRTTAVLLASLLAGHALLAWQLRARGIFTLGDDAAYMLLSRSLRAFSYRELQFVGEPIAARYPPVYPALLALCSSVFGERLNVVALVGIVFSVSGIWALFDVVRRRWSARTGLVVAALVAVNPAVLEYVGLPMTETVFTSLVIWTLWVADRANDLSGSERSRPGLRWFPEGCGIAVSVLAALTRSAGVTLPISLFVHWVWRRQWRAATALALSATIVVGGWLAWTSLAPKRDMRLSYIDDVVRPGSADVAKLDGSSGRAGEAPSFAKTIANRLAYNVPTYVAQVSLTMLPVPVIRGTVVDNVLWVLVLGGLFLVGWVSAWNRWQVASIYIAGYCALLAIWPYMVDRFLVPIVPLGLAFIAIGADRVSSRLRARPDIPLAVFAAPLIVFAVQADGALVEKASECDRARVDCARPISLDFVDAARAARTFTPATARFITPKGGTFYFHSGRQSVFWEETIRQDSASFLSYLRRGGVTHVVATPVYGDYVTVLALVGHYCAQFAVARSFSPHTAILEFRGREATANEGNRACNFVRRALATEAVVTDPALR
jgi:hypothetical protein